MSNPNANAKNAAPVRPVASPVPPIATARPPASPADAMAAEIARLKAENESLKSKTGGGALRCKVSEKGALSIYGLGRFPVTLYKGQWLRLIAFIRQVEEFIKANEATLAVKGE